MIHRRHLSKTSGFLIAVAVLFIAGASTPSLAQRGKAHESPHKKLTRSCEKCHVATSFKEIRFDHAETRFALDGHHDGLPCLACHSVENFSELDGSCVSCHKDIHKGRLGVDCARCHTSEGWNTLDFVTIHSQSNTPIMGRHALLDCKACHRGLAAGDFFTARSECSDCHMTDYHQTQDPPHTTNGFSTMCDDCHRMTAWKPADMVDHDAIFPIFSGTHRAQWTQCSECHPVPQNKSVFTCLPCHEQPVTDPVHQGFSGYSYTSQACLSCHPTGVATALNHDAWFFPIYSGKHQGLWNNDCSTCHTVPENRSIFTCFSCHEHNQRDMDDKHHEVRGYSYTSQACLSCHPRGVRR